MLYCDLMIIPIKYRIRKLKYLNHFDNKIRRLYSKDNLLSLLESYKKDTLLAGLILFPEECQYKDREPTKIFEYMAAGLPIICSNFPIWKNIVERNNCGICVDPLNSKEILDAINYISKNPDRAAIMGCNGREAVREIYNWAIEEKRFLVLYQKILLL